MNKHLQKLLQLIQQDEVLNAEQKNEAIKSLKDADKELEVTTFKLDRTEKVKRTAEILLEETITELEQKRKSVEEQNRELEIEAAMEKVRARSLAMQKPGELMEVAKLLRKEMGALGVEELETSSIYIIEDTTGTGECWYAIKDVRGEDKELVSDHMTLCLDDTWVGRQMQQFYRSTEKHASILMQGENRKEWINYCAGKSSVLQGYYGGEIPERTYHLLKFSNGFMGAASSGAISAESWDLLHRATAVFSFAYTRFRDLQKAEAQAREAKIELALERVRARTLAMQGSDELQESALLLFQQAKALGASAWTCGYNIWDEDLNAATSWMGNTELGIQNKSFKVPTQEHVFKNIFEEAQRGESLYVHEISGEAIGPHYEYMYTLPEAGNRLKNFVAAGGSLPTIQILHCAFFSKGYLLFITLEPIPELWDVFKRFAKVFEQTYTRFLDLQKAEAQAREAKIEAALEKVRSRSLAMHKSDELWEVIALVFEKFQELNFAIDGAAFITTFIEGTRDINVWVAGNDSQPYPTNLRLPYLDSPTLNDQWQAKESGLDFFSKTYSFEEKNHWLRYAFEHTGLKSMTDEWKNWILEQPYLTQSIALANNSIIGIHFHHQKTLTENEIDIQKRFSKVFDQAYIRFLDLQKAEAQAREAKIEGALERVRSRTMAMHKSEELAETASILFKQLIDLGIATNRLYIIIMNEEASEFEAWGTAEDGANISHRFKVNIEHSPAVRKMYDGWRERKKSLTIDLQGKELEDYIHYLSEVLQAPVTVGHSQKRRVQNIAYFSKGLIGMASPEPQPETTVNLLERFAGVFNQTYTRFLDLQKAEAQAREAQIQLSLERVRAKAMGMHHSDELSEVLSVLFEQYDVLDIRPIYVYLSLFDLEKRTFTYRLTGKAGQRVIAKQILDVDAMEEWVKTAEFWATSKPLTVNCYDYPPEKIPRIFELIHEIRNKIPEEARPQLTDFPTGLFITQGYTRFGWLGFAHNRQATEEEKNIVVRVATEFDRLYQRFLDLQKAEGQAREAKIEAALERVRTRAMAMHKTDELLDAAERLYHELTGLGITSFSVTYSIMSEDEKSAFYYGINPVDGKIPANPFVFLHTETDVMKSILQSWKKQEPVYTLELDEEGTLRHQTYVGQQILSWIKKNNIDMPFSLESFIEVSPKKAFINTFNFSQGYIFSIGGERLTGEQQQILLRFTKVFELTYRRFLDLQKAEAQAREAQIEAALERVRSRTMAMQRSEELRNVAEILFKQVKELGIEPWASGFNIWQEGNDSYIDWVSTPAGFLEPYTVDLTTHPVFREISNAKKRGEDFYVLDTSGKALEETYALLISFAPKQFEGIIASGIPFPTRQINHYVYGEQVGLMFITPEPCPEAHDIFKRFGKVFEQTYTRFLDLQKAEAQAREAQIEAALEKIRSRSLAMHHSNEMKNVIAVMFQTMHGLNILHDSIAVQLFDEETKNSFFWVGNLRHDEPPMINLPFDEKMMKDDSYLKDSWEARKTNTSIINKEYSPAQKNNYFDYVFANNNTETMPQHVRDSISSAQSHIVCLFVENNSTLFVDSFSGKFFDEEKIKTLRRAARVFEQAYTRFLDLQKAEAQARQALIEAAMEKVRARSSAMQKPEEIIEVVELLRKEMGALGVEELETSSIYILDDTKDSAECWYAIKDVRGENKKLVTDHMTIRLEDTWVGREMHKFYQSDEMYVSILMQGENRKDWINYCASKSKVLDGYYGGEIPERTYHLLKFSNGFMGAASPGAISNESWDLLQRATSAFSFAYTRFMDLHRAEEQAKEARIELALERVRARTMAMYKSDELKEVIQLVYEQFVHLGIHIEHTGFIMDYKSRDDMHIWLADKKEIPSQVTIPYFDSPHWNSFNEAKEKGKDFFANYLTFEEKNRFYKDLFKVFPLPDEVKEYYFSCPALAISTVLLENIGLYIENFSGIPYTDEENKTLQRFGKVFQQTYTRFNDLQKAEARAIETVKRASVDRVRAEIASMRTTADLQRITPLVWNELKTLGVPFTRCGVFIMDEAQRQIHTFLSTPEGKAITSFHLPYDAPGAFNEIVSNWEQKKIFNKYWGEAEFLSVADALVKQGSIANREQYMATVPSGVHLHCLPFLQGMLYVGNTANLGEDELQLAQNLADAFSTAYARYEDFNKLEAANIKIEKTLTDLKQTQTQLVQSEKMASLGELTAGIAHEIQNPLNFVNNFSEVSTELVDEMNAELATGNLQQATEIANDLRQNLEKINHHGKRAGDIVKGMLQHSRTSSGQKELTDLNALCDEYLRLSYHGLRAKNKSFNAKFETDLDSTLPKINVIPQDIGRVVLNLINNAFYAVSEKSKSNISGYEPTVVVSTKNSEGKIEIIVKDNGTGIPQKVIDKIFQPFFTTKPTGQGTGLGLSLSYDIVKAHGGELKVETKIDEGSKFIITVPII